MKSFQSFISDVLSSVVATVMILMVGIVCIVAMPIFACLFIIVLFFGLGYYLMGGKLPDILNKKTLDKD